MNDIPPISTSHRSWNILFQHTHRTSRAFSLFIALLTSLHAQSPDPQVDFQLQTKPHLGQLPTGENAFKWTGQADRIYFLQSTSDLRKWNWFPVIKSGVAAPMAYPVAITAANSFFRIASTTQKPQLGLSLENWDADGDHISNWAELTSHGSNPLLADTDADGLPDDWEIAHSLNVTDNGTQDPQNGPDAIFDDGPSTGGTTNFQACSSGVRAVAGATTTDLDGDLIPNAQDADPVSTVINWHKTSKPAYVAIPIPGWNAGLHAFPFKINNHNDLLTSTTLFKNGQWTPLNNPNVNILQHQTPTLVMPYTFSTLAGLHTTTLKETGVSSISDTGEVMGWMRLYQEILEVFVPSTNEYVQVGGFFPYYPAIWRTPQSLPEIYGSPHGTVLNRPWQDGAGGIARDGTVVTTYDNEYGYLSDIVSIHRYPTAANGGGVQSNLAAGAISASIMGQGGHVAYRTFIGGVTPQSWIWPANGAPQVLNAVTTSVAGGTPINFQTIPKMIGKAPGGATCINLDAQVLIESAGRYHQVPSLQGADKISEHGTAIKSGLSGNPTIWHGGSNHLLRDCVINQSLIGSTLYVSDMNDRGSILAQVDPQTPNARPVILHPVEVRDVKEIPIIADDQVVQPATPLPMRAIGESDTALRTRLNTYFQTEIPDASIAWIDPHRGAGNTPDMPRLVAKVIGAPSTLKVKWRLEVAYLRGNGYRASYVEDFTRPDDTVMIPAATSSNPVFTAEIDGDQEWRIFESADWQQEIAQRGFFGGTAKVYLWIPSSQPTATTEPFITFRIGGKNPDPALARTFLDTAGGTLFPYLYAIGRHETFGRVRVNGVIRYYNQFYTDYKGGTIGDASVDMGWAAWSKGWPLYNLDRGTVNGVRRQNGPGGYGMYQLTLGPKRPVATVPANQEQFITRRQIWNWQDNARGAVAELQGKRTQALTLQSGLASAYSQWPALPNEGSLSGLDAIIVSYYNGVGGLPLSGLKVNGKRRPTCWSAESGTNSDRVWIFHQNQQRYIQSINAKINTTKP
jgi:hypothetical protein